TIVYAPKDDSRTYPILFTRIAGHSNAGPYGIDQYRSELGPSPAMAKDGYIFVSQDVRGRFMSEGTFVCMRPHNPNKRGPQDIDESSDTYDTIDWLVKYVANHNGKVGLYGASLRGFYTAAGMIDAHPALKAASPQAPVLDWFMGDDWHHNGALFLAPAFNYLANFDKPRPRPIRKAVDPPFEHGTSDDYDFFLRLGPLANANTKYFKGELAFWNDLMEHGTYDEFWRARNLRPHLRKIKPAVLTVGGWFDADNLFGTLEAFRMIEANSPDTANFLVMGPWEHGGWISGDGASLGNVAFNAKTADFYREKVLRPFFEFYLKGKGSLPHPKAWVFESGTNQWRQLSAWPPRNTQAVTLYFHPHGRLDATPPDDAPSSAGFDEYVSDPAKPVPFINTIGQHNIYRPKVLLQTEYMVADQRFAARRPDVLVYETDVLEKDITLAGPVTVELHVSTSGTDADWIVKLIDVYPNDYPDPNPNPKGVRLGGYQQLVRGDVMRGKFRNSFEQPTPFTPGQPTVVRFNLLDAFHTFRSGHRIMVQVQSSWFPLVDRNPQSFVHIATAKESDFHKATQRLYRSKAHASRLTLSGAP
ncbi:MAG TPA: CocE/NonD family hydrolase, partial [Gemmataceae bacterium]|nr:CocE/NonD family hydrolase [Gemmataceae bacterium]